LWLLFYSFVAGEGGNGCLLSKLREPIKSGELQMGPYTAEQAQAVIHEINGK